MTNNLITAIESAGSAVEMLRNSKAGIYVYPCVAPEFSDWRAEQKAWRDSSTSFFKNSKSFSLHISRSVILKIIKAQINKYFRKADFFIDKELEGRSFFHVLEKSGILINWFYAAHPGRSPPIRIYGHNKYLVW